MEKVSDGRIRRMNRGLSGVDFVVIGIYVAVLVVMGLTIARRQKSTEDFFVAGRSLPAWAVGISLCASLLSTITYLGLPGEMFRTGIGYLTTHLGVPVVLLMVWFLWVPFFMRLKLTSAYEYLEMRFNYPTRVLGAVFCLLLLLGWMAVVVLTVSRALAEITVLDLAWFFGTNTAAYRDADVHAIILAIGLFSVVYTMMGGIRAVVWTDVIQFVILIGGAFFALVYVMWTTDSGLSDWLSAQQAYAYRESVEWFSWDIGNRSTIFSITIGTSFWVICTHGANQMALQRYFSVKGVWAARRSYLVNALANLGLTLVLAAVGLCLLYFIQEHPVSSFELVNSPDREIRVEAQDKIFPQFIATYLPAGLKGLVVAALFAAAMSTIDSGANSISTIVTLDFVRRLNRGKKRSAATELRIARLLTGLMGVVIVASTICLYHVSKGTDIITLCQKGFNCFLGPLGALFVLGMFSRHSTPSSVIPAVFVGEIVGVCASYSQELFDVSYSTHLVVPGSWLATIVTGVSLGFLLSLFGITADKSQKAWMWRPVVKKLKGKS